jgi:hypothetical protein
MINAVNFQVNRQGDVVANHLEPVIIQQVKNIAFTAGKKVIQAKNFMSLLKQPFA